MRKTIKELRLAQGITQLDLAAQTGIPQDQLSKIELHKRGASDDKVSRICSVLGCSPQDLDVLPPRASGGQARPAGDLLAQFRGEPVRAPRPEWTSAMRIASLKADLPDFMRRFAGKLDGWQPFLAVVPSEIRDETILQLLELNRGALPAEASTHYLGFRRWPVCDEKGRCAAHLLRPVLVTPDWVLAFQVYVLTPQRYRMDGLLIVNNPRRTTFNLEVDGKGHNAVDDAKRARAIDLPTLRIPNSDLIKGPSITERLRAIGFCLPH